MTGLGASSGWVAFGALGLATILGWILRRRGGGPWRSRMRPHELVGYGALALAFLHFASSTGALGAADRTGLKWGAAALVAMCLQIFVGVNLLGPGSYRRLLLLWHRAGLALVLAFALAHVVIDAPQSLRLMSLLGPSSTFQDGAHFAASSGPRVERFIVVTKYVTVEGRGR